MKRFFGIAAVLSVMLAGALMTAPLARAAGDHDTLDKGPKVGATIPLPLKARDQDGKARDFNSLSGERGLVLLFSRSLDW